MIYMRLFIDTIKQVFFVVVRQKYPDRTMFKINIVRSIFFSKWPPTEIRNLVFKILSPFENE